MDSITVEKVPVESVIGEVVPVESVPVESLNHCWQLNVDISVYLSPLQVIVAVKCVTVNNVIVKVVTADSAAVDSATIDGLTASSSYNRRRSNRQLQ